MCVKGLQNGDPSVSFNHRENGYIRTEVTEAIPFAMYPFSRDWLRPETPRHKG